MPLNFENLKLSNLLGMFSPPEGCSNDEEDSTSKSSVRSAPCTPYAYKRRLNSYSTESEDGYGETIGAIANFNESDETKLTRGLSMSSGGAWSKQVRKHHSCKGPARKSNNLRIETRSERIPKSPLIRYPTNDEPPPSPPPSSSANTSPPVQGCSSSVSSSVSRSLGGSSYGSSNCGGLGNGHSARSPTISASSATALLTAPFSPLTPQSSPSVKSYSSFMFGPELTPDPMKVAAKTESVFEFPTTLSANYLSTPRRRRNSKSCSIITPTDQAIINPELYKKDDDEEESDSDSDIDDEFMSAMIEREESSGGSSGYTNLGYPSYNISDKESDNLRIKLSAKYSKDTETLDVKVKKLRNLPQDIKTLGIKVTLMPDHRRVQNSIVNINPESYSKCNSDYLLNQRFQFQVSSNDVYNHVLKLTLTNNSSSNHHHHHHTSEDGGGDKRRSSNSFLGEITKPLKVLRMGAQKDVNFTISCDTLLDKKDQAKIHISLCYNPNIPRLTISVFECEGLEDLKQDSQCYYVKLIVQRHLKKSKTKKTEIIRGEKNPTFAESFHFKIMPDELDGVGITLIVREQQNMLAKCHNLGQVVLGASMFSQGSGSKHWREALLNPKEQILMWHNISVYN